MQLKNIYLTFILSFVFFLSAVASCSQTISIKLNWRQISINEAVIDATLTSGVEVEGIRYRKDKMSEKWLLEFKSTSGTMIRSGGELTESLSKEEFHNLFSELISSILVNNSGKLDSVHIGLGIISDFWEETLSYLRKDAVPANYKLIAKDLDLARKISSHLKNSWILKAICKETMQINKNCENNFVSMNPITFKRDYIGKEWYQVEELSNAGIQVDVLWFGLSLTNMTKK